MKTEEEQLARIADAHLALTLPDRRSSAVAVEFQQAVCAALSHLLVYSLQTYAEDALDEELNERPLHPKAFKTLLTAIMTRSADFSEEDKQKIDQVFEKKLFIDHKENDSENMVLLLILYLRTSSIFSLLSAQAYEDILKKFPQYKALKSAADHKMATQASTFEVFKRLPYKMQQQKMLATFEALKDSYEKQDFLQFIAADKQLLTCLKTPECFNIAQEVLVVFPQDYVLNLSIISKIVSEQLSPLDSKVFPASTHEESLALARKISTLYKGKTDLSSMEKLEFYHLIKHYMDNYKGETLHTKLDPIYQALKADVENIYDLYLHVIKSAKTFTLQK